MSGTVVYGAIIGFAVGIGIRSFFDVPYAWLLGLLLVSLWCAVVGTRRSSRRAQLASIFLLLCVGGVVRFDSAMWLNDTSALRVFEGQSATLEGVVSAEPEHRETTTHIYLDLSSINQFPVTDRVLVYAPRTAAVAYGDRVRVTGEVVAPQSFTTDLGRTFNYPGYLAVRGVSHVLFYPDIAVLESQSGSPLLERLYAFKHSFMTAVESVLPEPQAGLAGGLLLGIQSGLGDQLNEAFRRTGIIHIVVLSGYNIMLVVLFVTTLLSYICGLRLRLVFGLLSIVGFAVLVGLSATVMRASIMAALILIARTFGKTYDVLRALVVAGGIMLILNPRLLMFDPGFQLSFLATVGLILIAPHLEQRLSLVPTRFGIREFLVATVATQLFVLPFLLYQIGQFSVVAVLVNVLVLPLVPLAMLGTFITGMLALVAPALAMPFGYLTYLSLTYIIGVVTRFADLPFAAFSVPAFAWWWMVLAYALMGYVLWRLSVRTLEHGAKDNESVTLPLTGWTIVDEIEAREMAELSKDNSATPPVYFR